MLFQVNSCPSRGHLRATSGQTHGYLTSSLCWTFVFFMTDTVFKMCTNPFLLNCSQWQFQIDLAMILREGDKKQEWERRERPREQWKGRKGEWNRREKKKIWKWARMGFYCSSVKKGFEFIWITDLMCHQPIFISCLTVQYSVGITTSACVIQGSSQLNLYLSIPSTPLPPPSTIFNAFPVCLFVFKLHNFSVAAHMLGNKHGSN